MLFVLLLIILSVSETVLQARAPTFTPNPRSFPPTAMSGYLTESRYNFLLDLIIQERQSRNNLEKEVLELRTRLQITEQESRDSWRNV